MKIDLQKLEQKAVGESLAERNIAADRKENGDMYKASFRIAMKIKRALRIKNMTQARLSNLMGVDPAIVNRYLTGKANMELKTMVKIEKALGINIIDREISPKKQKVLILSNVFENVGTLSQNNIADCSVHRPYELKKIKVNSMLEACYSLNKIESDYVAFSGGHKRMRKSQEVADIKFLEVV